MQLCLHFPGWKEIQTILPKTHQGDFWVPIRVSQPIKTGNSERNSKKFWCVLSNRVHVPHTALHSPPWHHKLVSLDWTSSSLATQRIDSQWTSTWSKSNLHVEMLLPKIIKFNDSLKEDFCINVESDTSFMVNTQLLQMQMIPVTSAIGHHRFEQLTPERLLWVLSPLSQTGLQAQVEDFGQKGRASHFPLLLPGERPKNQQSGPRGPNATSKPQISSFCAQMHDASLGQRLPLRKVYTSIRMWTQVQFQDVDPNLALMWGNFLFLKNPFCLNNRMPQFVTLQLYTAFK